MKKFMICLLSLGIILSGCIQNERPEEPPVVEDETKQPSENIDNKNSQTKQEYVKKIDTAKDWIYLQDDSSFDSNSDIDEWIIIQVDTKNEVREDIFINIDSEDAEKYNKNHSFHPDKPSASGGLGYASRESRWYIYDDILVVLCKYYNGIYKTEAYMYDLITGKQILLDELLDKYCYTRESASKYVTDQLIEKGYRIIGRDEYVSGEKHFVADSFGSGPYPNYTSAIDENSTVYISPLGKLSVLIEIKQYKDNQNTYSLEIIEIE